MPREIIHIHQLDGEPCIVCGDADDGTSKFTDDPEYWNTLNSTCSPTTRLRPDYTVSGREDPRTSALKGERKPLRSKVPDQR